MLPALAPVQRAAYVLGVICELEASEAAYVLGVSEVAFRKRLSRARTQLDAFMSKHCGAANPRNRCRCAFQVNYNVARRCIDPQRLQYAQPAAKTSLEALQALGEIEGVRRSLELYRAQPAFSAPEELAKQLRGLIAATSSLSLS
jgi:hypothetical protein